MFTRRFLSGAKSSASPLMGQSLLPQQARRLGAPPAALSLQAAISGCSNSTLQIANVPAATAQGGGGEIFGSTPQEGRQA